MGVEKIYELNFSNNQFKSIDFFKGIREVKRDLKLNNNYISDLNGLQDIAKVGGLLDLHNNSMQKDDINYLRNLREVKELYIYNNYFFESLNGIKNIKGNTKEDPVILRIEPTSLYKKNYSDNRWNAKFPEDRILPILDLYTPLCYGIATKRTIAYEKNGSKEADMSLICEGITNDAAWLEFFKDNNYLLEYKLLEEWERDDSIVTLSNQNFTNEDLPTGSMGIKSLYSLDFSNNNITNVIFMGVTEKVRGDLDLSNNNIESLKGLNSLKTVEGELRLHNNNYNDLTPISNIGIAKTIRVDNPEGFEKLSYTSALCRGIKSGSVNVYVGEQKNRLTLEDICYTADTDPNTAWLNFFQTNGQLTDFEVLEDWETDLEIADVSNNNFSNTNIPTFIMNINELGTLNFSDNNLVDAFFLLNINKVKDINLSNNNLSNLDGLSNILQGVINVSGNNNVTSILPLSNLIQSKALKLDSVEQYTNKPLIETDFCQGVLNLNINPLTTERELSLKDVCIGGTEEEEWLSFFQAANKTLLKLNSIKSWEFKDEEALIVDNKDSLIVDPYIPVENLHMPSSNLPVSSLFSLNIVNQEISNLNFLSSVNEIRKSLNLSGNKLTDITGLSSINTKIPKLVLSGNPLGSTTGLGGLEFDVLDLSNTQLSNLNDISFTEIDNFYLNDNVLTNLNGLENLTVVNKEMTIVNNPNLVDITGISNLSKGTLIVDPVEQYTVLPDYSTPFCKAILSNDLKVVKIEEVINEEGKKVLGEVKIYVEEVCQNVTDDGLWLSFFHRNNQLLKLDLMNEWNTKDEAAYLSSHILNEKGEFKELSEIIFDNTMLPSGNIGVTSLFDLNFSHNELTSINFLNGLEEVRGNLALNNNNLENINALSELSKVEKTIDLSNTTITDLSPLSKLKKVGTLDVSGNPNLTDLLGIENLANALTLYLDDPSQYELIDFTSDLCFAISRGEVLPKVKATGNGIYIEELCNGVPNDAKWLSYLQSKGQLLGFTMLNDWERLDATATVTGQALTVAEIPSARMPTSQIYKLDMSDNDISKISFLNLVEVVREEINFSNNRIDNISGLGRLKSAKTINLSSNNIESLDDMNSIETITNLNISNNPDLNDISKLRNISGVVDLKMNNIATTTLAVIENYDSLNTLEFEGSPVTDISVLANLNVRNIKLSDPLLFTSKPDFSSKFCQEYYTDVVNNTSVSNREFNITYNGKVPYITNLCDNVPSDVAWLMFFKAENQLLDFTNFSDWETVDKPAEVTGINLVNDLLPPTPFELNSIYFLNMSNNNLDNVNFLSGVNEIRTNLLLNDNNITDFTGMDDLQSVFELNISNNDMTIFNPLNLKTVSSFTIDDNSNLEELNFPLLERINELNITNNSSLKTLLMPSLNEVVLNTKIENNGEVEFSINNIDFNGELKILNNQSFNIQQDNMFRVGSDYFINDNNNLESITLNVSDEIGRHLYIKDNNSLRTIDIQSIANLGWALNVERNNVLESLSINNIGSQGGNTGFVLSNNPSLNNLSINNINNIAGNLSSNGNENLKTIDINNVGSISNNLDLTVNNKLEIVTIKDLSRVGRNIIVSNLPSLKEFSLSNIENINLNLTLTNNPELTKVTLNNVQKIGRNTKIENNGEVEFSINNIDFNGELKILNNQSFNIQQDNMFRVGSDYFINDNNNLESITLNVSDEIGRHLYIKDNNSLRTIDIQSIANLGWALNVERNNVLESLSINNIGSQGGNTGFVLSNNPSLNNLSINNINNIAGNLSSNGNENLKTIDINNVGSISNNLDLTVNNKLEIVTIKDLSRVGRNIIVSNLPSLKEFSLSNIENINLNLTLTNNPELTKVTLNNVQKIGRNTKIENNPKLNDLSGLANLYKVGTTFDIDEPSQYTILPDYETPFCRGITASDIIPEYNTDFVSILNLCNNVPEHAIWLDIFHSYNQMREVDTIFEWDLDENKSNVNLSNKGLSENDFPDFPINSSKLYIFNISNNSFTQLDILDNLTEIRDSLYAQNNLINDISNLYQLTRVENKLDLSNNKLINVDSLSNLTYVGNELSLHTNESLIDISGLRNITHAKRIELDSPEQYSTVMDATSPFCQALAVQDIKVYVGNTSEKIQMRFLCKNADDTDLWLNLFHSYDQLLNFSLMNEWESKSSIGDLSENDLSYLDIPKSPLETTSLYDLRLNDNSIINLDFMSNVVNVRKSLNAENNEINNIDGLQNITNYIELNLSNNVISDTSPLDNIQTGLVQLDLSFNDIERVPNLSNFTKIDNLYFNNNVSLTDISGLSTIKEIKNLHLQDTQVSDLHSLSGMDIANRILLDDPNEYSPKLDYTTNFCDGIKNDLIFPYYDNQLIDIRDLCQNFTDDYLWLLFFRDNGQLVSYNDISEWVSKDGTVTVTNLLLSDSELPEGLIGVNTLYTLNLSGNILTNVNFMQDVVEVRQTLNLSNNNLNDISGLTNMSSIINLYLQDNPNLGDISALSNLAVVNDLNISNTGRSDLSGLDSLVTITGTFDITNNENLKDISLLNKIISAKKIVLANEEQYIKLDYDTNPVCKNINNGTVAIYNIDNDRLSANHICYNTPSELLWLKFLKTFDKQNDFAPYYSLQEWLTKNTIADVSLLNLVESDIPEGSIGIESIYGFNISDNEITHVDFMIDTKEIRDDLILNNNLISNIDGLQNLTNYLGDLNLRSNKLTNVDGLSNLTQWGIDNHQGGYNYPYGGNPGVTATNLDLRYNDLLNVDGLINMTAVRYANLYISDNPNLTNISGLSNIQLVDNVSRHRHTKSRRGCGSCGYSVYSFYVDHLHYIVIDDPSQYTVKPEATSPFCTAVTDRNVTLKTATSAEHVTSSEVCNVVDQWMLFLHSYNKLKWEVVPESIDNKNLIIDLSNTNISNEVLPNRDLTFSNPYILNLSNNNLDNIDFMTTLTGIRNQLNISGNNIANIDGLSNIVSIAGSVWLNNNEQLTDLTGISNISTTNSGKIYIDSPAQYTNKPFVESALCQGMIAGNVLVDTYNSETMTSREVTALELCDASNAWLDFLKENGQATELLELSELNNQETPIDLSNNGFVEADLPIGALGIENLLNFNISNNQLSDFKFLLELKNVKENLNISGNTLTNLYGLDNILLVEGNLDISNNTSLTDISNLSNLQRVVGVLYVDEPVQYSIKPDISSDFCIALSNDLINVEEKSTSRKVDVNEMCSTSDKWLTYFYENNVLFDNLTLQDWNTDNLTLDISSNNLVNSDVPSVAIDLTEIYNFNISENNFVNIDFMSNITKINSLIANDNELVNVNGLSSVTEVTQELNIQRNKDLTDITGLANISSGVIYMNNESQYINKPDVTTPFCLAVYNSTGTATNFDETTLKVGQVCSTTDQWLQHFYNNNFMIESVDIKDMEDIDVEIDFSNRNYTNSSIPSALLGVNSIYKMDFKNNQLTQINFLAGVSEVRDSLDLSLNSLTNLNGLFSLTVANNIFLNGNNLTDISGLVNLQELTGYLYLNSNPNLTNISYLENLQVNNPNYPIYLDDPSQYTKKVDGSSMFCIALQNDSLTVVNANTGLELTKEDLCSYSGIYIDEDGYFTGLNTNYTYIYPQKLVSGDKRYAEWEYKDGDDISTKLGIGMVSKPNTSKNRYISQTANSIAFWGYTWTGNITDTTANYTDTSTNARLGISFDYSKFPIEASLYVNGVLQETKIYNGTEDTFYLAFSRYYIIPPHKMFFESEQLYRPEGFDSF